MDHSLDKKIETKEKVLILLKKNKLKLYIFSHSNYCSPFNVLLD